MGPKRSTFTSCCGLKVDLCWVILFSLFNLYSGNEFSYKTGFLIRPGIHTFVAEASIVCNILSEVIILFLVTITLRIYKVSTYYMNIIYYDFLGRDHSGLIPTGRQFLEFYIDLLPYLYRERKGKSELSNIRIIKDNIS